MLAQLHEHFPYLLELHGKSLEENGEMTALTVGQIQTMDEMDIMKKFCEETFSCEPTKEQEALFKEVLEWSEKEAELS